MKIYTGTGDGGKTGLFSGERIKKNGIRVEAYGAVDELCSFVGVIGATLPECREKMVLAVVLEEIQADLFNIGVILATLPTSPDISRLQPVDERVTWLESRIDLFNNELEGLRSFILPGGHPAAAWSQVARSVCRRAERAIVSLVEEETGEKIEAALVYMNRLSDFFFVVARYCNKVAGVAETTWRG